MSSGEEGLVERLNSYLGQRLGPVFAWDEVNAPMIRQWREALGYADVLRFADHADQVSPATMLPVWLMLGVEGRAPPGSDARDNRAIMKVLEADGYTGILGTNCEQEYMRPLKAGERIASFYEVAEISSRKQTKFGPGFFITFLQTFIDAQDAVVGTMRLRILRYKPSKPAAQLPAVPQPAMSADTKFFWDGLQQQKLLIQRCTACGTLRHPPGPACTACHALEWDALQASGKGEIYSFVSVHAPQYAGYEYPHPVGLIALDEGVRMVAPLSYAERETIAIGDRVEAVFAPPSDTYHMPTFKRLASEKP